VINASQVVRWLQSGSLMTVKIQRRSLFPVLRTNDFMPIYQAYLTKSFTSFPENSALGMGNGLCKGGQFYRLEFDGFATYCKQQIDAMLALAGKELN
jgi:hypothetical protein